MRKIFFILPFLLFFLSCSSPKWVLTEMKGSKIALDASTEAIADESFNSFLSPYKQQLDAKMDEVIGRVEQNMRAHKPESLLSNWSADVYLKRAAASLGEPVDVAIVNLGGLRTQIPKGNFTVRKVFELMPFENELVILWLKGSDLNDLLQFFASIGGQGVGGLRMEIRDGKALNIQVGGKALEMDKLYSIATNDYLAEGNDYMSALTKQVKRVNTGILIRDMLMDYVRAETAAGRNINSKLDGRIVNHEN
ncbi:MAG: 5'-nucleotidase C-terminal domain-containing protein [Paludibacter sp.]|nr:5'-nucleotidase C-terminal domain-containing protein [Paludibacter sp.]